MARFLAGVMKFRLLILAAAIGVLAVGLVQLRDTSLEVLPEFSPPYAEIQTEALGLSAEEVEQLITVPLEQDLLNGVEGVDGSDRNSLPGLSSIVMVFEPGTDIYRGCQLIEERLAQAHALPNVSKPPTLLQPLVVGQPGGHDRHVHHGLDPDRTVGHRALDRTPAAHGSAWRCQRLDLGLA